MDVRRLEYLVALVREGGFTRAAAACGVSQPTLSQQILKLEEAAGVPLIRRLRSGVALTEAGRDFHRRAVNVLAELAYAKQEADAHAGKLRGTLRLGAIPTVAPYVLPELLAGFRSECPDVAVEAVEAVTDSLVARLLNGELDAALVALPIGADHLRSVPVAEDALLVAVPTDHRAAKAGKVTWESLADEPWLLLEEAHCLGAQTRDLCRRAGLAPRVVLRGAQLATVLGLVSRGLGVAVVPAMAAKQLPAGVVLVPFAGRAPVRRIALVMRESSGKAPPPLKAFVDFLKARSRAKA